MAVSLKSNSYPHVVNLTLGTSNTMTELQVGGNARRVEIVFTSNAGKLLTAGTDATIISTEASFPIPADSSFFYDVSKAQTDHSVYLASASPSTVVSCIVTDGD